MSWEETPSGRLTLHIFAIFDEYLSKHPAKDSAEHNALLDVRNSVLQYFENFLQEPSIQKRYGVPIDSLSLVSFPDNKEPLNPQSSWLPIPGGESGARPAGITNEEFTEYSDQLFKLMYNSGPYIAVLNIFREAFLRPAENRPFKEGTYTRLVSNNLADVETIKRQAVPCEICGENRSVDLCHIIPRRLKGSERIDNIIILCPTHHRLFDACMLSKEEWDKIGWSRKAGKSQRYAEMVLKVAHGKFWEKVEAGIYRKQTTWELDIYEKYKENEKDIELGHENEDDRRS